MWVSTLFSTRQFRAFLPLLLLAPCYLPSANAAQVIPPPKPVASEFVLHQPGEPMFKEKTRSNPVSTRIQNTRDYTKDDSKAGNTSLPVTTSAITATPAKP